MSLYEEVILYTGQKRALPALAMSVMKNPKVQEAVVDKGLEVMNKLVDKQLRIIDEAQEKASKFLAKEVSRKMLNDYFLLVLRDEKILRKRYQ